MPLHTNHRPKTLEEVRGNPHIVSSLESIFAREDRPHAFLFAGPKGTGKTTLARIIADLLGCDDEDVQEYNIGKSGKVDVIREIVDDTIYAPSVGKVKVYILDEVHMATPAGQNALLKTLEDTPSHCYFVLCTTESDKLLSTIVSRCSRYQTKLMNNKDLKLLIEEVLSKEGVTDFSPKVLAKIIEVSEGTPRDALVYLDQVIDLLDEEAAIAVLESFSINNVSLKELCQVLLGGTTWDRIRARVAVIVKELEPEKIRYGVLGYMTAVLLGTGNHARASEIIDTFSINSYDSGKAGIVNMFYMVCSK